MGLNGLDNWDGRHRIRAVIGQITLITTKPINANTNGYDVDAVVAYEDSLPIAVGA